MESPIRPGQAPFHLLALGPFAEANVRCVFTGERKARSAETERLIEEAWNERMAAAARRGQLLFSGPLCRLQSWSIEDGDLVVTFGRTDYREFVGTNIAHPEIGERLGPGFLADGCGVCTVIRTRDGHLVLQRRNERVFEYPGMLHVCGGALNPIERAGREVADPFAVMRREIEEELRLPAAAIAELVCLGLGRDGRTLKPEVLMQTTLAVDAAAITAATGEEHAALVTVPDDPASLNAWLTTHWDEVAPAGLACLVAHAACRFTAGLAAAWNT